VILTEIGSSILFLTEIGNSLWFYRNR